MVNLLGTTSVNVAAGVAKDAAFAKMFGGSKKEAATQVRKGTRDLRGVARSRPHRGRQRVAPPPLLFLRVHRAQVPRPSHHHGGTALAALHWVTGCLRQAGKEVVKRAVPRATYALFVSRDLLTVSVRYSLMETSASRPQPNLPPPSTLSFPRGRCAAVVIVERLGGWLAGRSAPLSQCRPSWPT